MLDQATAPQHAKFAPHIINMRSVLHVASLGLVLRASPCPSNKEGNRLPLPQKLGELWSKPRRFMHFGWPHTHFTMRRGLRLRSSSSFLRVPRLIILLSMRVGSRNSTFTSGCSVSLPMVPSLSSLESVAELELSATGLPMMPPPWPPAGGGGPAGPAAPSPPPPAPPGSSPRARLVATVISVVAH